MPKWEKTASSAAFLSNAVTAAEHQTICLDSTQGDCLDFPLDTEATPQLKAGHCKSPKCDGGGSGADKNSGWMWSLVNRSSRGLAVCNVKKAGLTGHRTTTSAVSPFLLLAASTLHKADIVERTWQALVSALETGSFAV